MRFLLLHGSAYFILVSETSNITPPGHFRHMMLTIMLKVMNISRINQLKLKMPTCVVVRVVHSGGATVFLRRQAGQYSICIHFARRQTTCSNKHVVVVASGILGDSSVGPSCNFPALFLLCILYIFRKGRYAQCVSWFVYIFHVVHEQCRLY